MPADVPADRQENEQFARTPLQLRHYSLTEKIRRVHSPQHGEKRATQIQTVSPAQRRFLLAGQRFIETGNTSHKRQARSRTAAKCDERIASRANLEPQSRSRLPRGPRSENGAPNLASRDGRNGDAWNSDNSG